MTTAKRRRPKRRERRALAREAARAGHGQTPRPGDPGPPDRAAAGITRGAVAGALALAVLVAASYLPALEGGFVWDDKAFAEEPIVHRWSGLWNIWFSPADIRNEGHYWPLVYTTFWLEHKLWGLDPLGYHLVNVLLHLLNTVLAWRLLHRLAVPGAWAVAAVFAVHPLHVESVAWIIERKDLLSAAFYLGAVLAWLRFTEAPARRRLGDRSASWRATARHASMDSHPASAEAEGRGGDERALLPSFPRRRESTPPSPTTNARGHYCLALGLYAAALLSKSIAVTLPAALLVLHWWKRGTVTGAEWLRLAPFFALGLAVTAADLAFYTSREMLDLGYSAAERMLIAGRALWFYTGKLLWPADLAVIYPKWEVHAGDVLGWVAVAGAVALAGLLWLARHRIGRGPLAGAAFFAVTLSPVLGFVDFGYMQFSFTADRFQYLAGLGVMAVLAGAAAHGVRRLPRALRSGAAGAFVVVLVVLGTLTWRQAGIYRDGVTFFSHIVALNPEARDAHLNLASALLDAQRVEEGLAASRVAVEQRPDAANAHVALGRALLVMDRFDEAEAQLSRALALDPGNWAAENNMAALHHEQGRFEEAVEWSRKMLAADAANAWAHGQMGFALYELERYDEAVESLERAIELAPESRNAGAVNGLAGRALQALGKLDAAERRFLRAARIDPADPTPLMDLAGLRVAQQRFDEADAYLRRVWELAPDNPAALQSVAEALRKRGRHEEAIESYRAVLALDPGFAMAHAGMGDALFRLGRYEAALESLGRSVELHSIPPTATARLILMGRASQALGRSSEAAAHYERAVAIDPRNAEALDHLAMARFGEQRYEGALDLYRTLLEVRPDHAVTLANIGAALAALNRPEEALESFERALSLDPDLETARSNLERLQRSLRERERR